MPRKNERGYTPCGGVDPHSKKEMKEPLKKRGNLSTKPSIQNSDASPDCRVKDVLTKAQTAKDLVLDKKAEMIKKVVLCARARRLRYGYQRSLRESGKKFSYASLVNSFIRSEVHVGVNRRYWSPGMLPYTYSRSGTSGSCRIDLIKTFRILERACIYLYRASQKGERFMFVGTKKVASEAVKEVSVKCGQYYVRDCWLPGTISNWSSVAACVSRLMYLRRLVASAEFFDFVKKERVSIWREKDKLEASLSGVVRLKKRPRVVIIVDPVCDKYAFRESIRQGLTVVSIVGTNANPYYVDFPVPGNSVTVHPIRLLLSILSLAITRTRGGKARLRVRGNTPRKKGSIVFS